MPAHLPRSITGPRPGSEVLPPAALRAIEGDHIRRTLEQAGGNRSRAARLLGIDRGTLARKLRALGLGIKRGS
jgi:transcriptional regulator of acetoin/glycerol metabolism